MDLPRSLPHALLARAAALGARPALGRAERARPPVRWVDYERLAGGVGRGFLARGLERGERVAILGPASPEWAATALGAMGAGGVVAPLLRDWSPELLKSALSAADPSVVVAGDRSDWERLRTVLPGLARLRTAVQLDASAPGDDAIPFDSLVAAGADLARWNDSLEQLGDDEVAVLAFTQGTLGEPRPVPLTHRNLLWSAARFARAAALSADEAFAVALPCGSIADVVLRLPVALLAGARVDAGADLAHLLDPSRALTPTLVAAGPLALEALAGHLTRRARASGVDPRVLDWARRRLVAQARRSGGRIAGLAARAEAKLAGALVQRPLTAREGLERVRRVFCVGGRVRPAAFDALAGLGLPVLAAYAVAEAGGFVSVQEPDFAAADDCGRPLPGVEVRVEPAGRIVVRSPAASAACADADGWVDTGDWGELDGDGRLAVHGRYAERFYTADGTAVSPTATARVLRNESLIGQAVVFGAGHNHLGALIALAPAAAAAFARRHGLQDELDQIASHPALVAALGRAVARASRHLPPGAAVQRYAVLRRPLSAEAGELNAAGEPRRGMVAARFRAEIDDLFAS